MAIFWWSVTLERNTLTELNVKNRLLCPLQRGELLQRDGTGYDCSVESVDALHINQRSDNQGFYVCIPHSHVDFNGSFRCCQGRVFIIYTQIAVFIDLYVHELIDVCAFVYKSPQNHSFLVCLVGIYSDNITVYLLHVPRDFCLFVFSVGKKVVGFGDSSRCKNPMLARPRVHLRGVKCRAGSLQQLWGSDSAPLPVRCF